MQGGYDQRGRVAVAEGVLPPEPAHQLAVPELLGLGVDQVDPVRDRLAWFHSIEGKWHSGSLHPPEAGSGTTEDPGPPRTSPNPLPSWRLLVPRGALDLACGRAAAPRGPARQPPAEERARSDRGAMSGVILTPDQRLRVFVSSTMEELAEERRAARRAVERLQLAPVMFELGARPHPPRSLYLAYLRQSHVFVGHLLAAIRLGRSRHGRLGARGRAAARLGDAPPGLPEGAGARARPSAGDDARCHPGGR